MADLQGGGAATYSHFGHVHAAPQYQQVSHQRAAASSHHPPGGLSVGIRGRDRPARNSGGGVRDHSGGHQRRPSRDSDAGSSASEQTAMQQQQPSSHPSPPSGALANGGDASVMGLASPGGGASTPKGTHRPPPPPGFGAAHHGTALGRQPAAASNGPGAPPQPSASLGAVARSGLGAVAPPAGATKPGSSTNGAATSTGPTSNGVVPNQHAGVGSASSSSSANNQQQQGSAPPSGGPVVGASQAGVGGSGAPAPGTAPGAPSTSGTGAASSTQLNPAAPPFRSLHGGSLEQVEGNLLAQADAGGIKDKVTKFHTLVRQRDALDACILSELSSLVGEAERQAAARETHRQQAAALEEARARVDSLTSQLADRDSLLATARRQNDEKDAALRARDAQIRKLEAELAEARRRNSTLERDLATATQRADETAAKLSGVQHELGALREAYRVQSENHAIDQQHQQQQAAAVQQQQQHQQQQQQQHVGDGWHHKGPQHMGPMGQPIHQPSGTGGPPDGSGAPSGPPFGAMGLAGLAGPPGPAAAGAPNTGMKGAAPPPPPPPGPGGFQMPPQLHPLFNPPPGAPGAMDAATAVQMAGFMDAANAAAAAGGAGGLFGDRFLPPHPPPAGMPLPPGFHIPPHPPPPPHPHHMAPFGAPPLPTPEEIQAKILDLLPSDPAEAVQWDERMDATLDAALAPLQWLRDLAHVYGSPRGFMMAHPELFAQRQDGAVYRAPRAGSSGGAAAGAGNVTGRLMAMPPPPPPGMGPPHAHAPFVMPGLAAAAGLMFGGTHY